MTAHKTYQWYLFLLVLILSSESYASFIIDDIKVDIKSSATIEAKELALAKGRKLAFIKILKLHDIYSDNRVKKINDVELENLIDFYMIKNEKFSNERYYATFQFSFNRAKISKVMQVLKKLPPSNIINQSLDSFLQKFILLPVYITNDEVYLWHKKNHWLKYFQKYSNYNDSFILPIGDVKDIMEIAVEDLKLDKNQGISNVLNRYKRDILAVIFIQKFNTQTDVKYTLSMKLFNNQKLLYATEPIVVGGIDEKISPIIYEYFINCCKKYEQETIQKQYTDISTYVLKVSLRQQKEFMILKNILQKLNATTSVNNILTDSAEISINSPLNISQLVDFLEQNKINVLNIEKNVIKASL